MTSFNKVLQSKFFYISLFFIFLFSVVTLYWKWTVQKVEVNNNWVKTIKSVSNTKVLAYIRSVKFTTITREGLKIEAKEKDQISSYDKIETGEKGETEIIFSDNSIIRLPKNTIIEFTNLSEDWTLINLIKWDLWSRILKPLYDKNFFTISTNEISTWVRWTSLFVSKKDTWTKTIVIDSFSQIKWEEGVLIKIDWLEKRIKPENSVEVSNEKKSVEKTITPLELYKISTFIRESTKKDIEYMSLLKEQTEKITWEIDVTLPTVKETESYFVDPIVKQKVVNYYYYKKETRDELLSDTKIDLKISLLKKELEKIKLTGTSEEIKKKQEELDILLNSIRSLIKPIKVVKPKVKQIQEIGSGWGR